MSDKYIEKSFLYLLVVSLLLHVGVFALLYYLPETKQPPPKEPVFIDLQQMPELKAQQQPRQKEAKRQSDQRMRVERETAPRGTDMRESTTPSRPPARPQPQIRQREVAKAEPNRGAATGKPSTPLPSERREPRIAPGSSVASLLRPKERSGEQKTLPQLFPGAGKMAKLEETYRRKYENDIAEGDTRFLNTDDILFGSFLRRFENSVYGVWRYPSEAAQSGTEGITPVKITFNRRGEIVRVVLLESSGSKILDDEVFRTLKAIGPVGAFPRGFDKDEFNLIAFFQYGGARRSLR
ncbi:MAG: TonB-dependent receptor [Geobacter sp.]|nr:MAG: TonB-dependent receptor [Geobacter sp.]